MNKLKIGLSALHFPVTMARYFWEALERRYDTDVYAVGPFFNNWIPWNGGMVLPQKYVKYPYIQLPANTAQLKVPYEAVVSSMPDDLDLFLVIDAGWHFATRPKAKVVALIKTDPHALPPQHYAFPEAYSDFVFNMQTPYMKPGEIYLPYAYDPMVHYQEEDTEKIYDACLIGLHYNSRSALVSELRNRGLNVYYDIGIVFDEYRHIYNSSKVALSWSSLQDLPARVWEALAMKIPLVCNHVPDMKRFFVDGEHYLGFDSVSEAVEKVEFLINNPDKAKEIAEAGWNAVRPHTWDARIEQILKDCGLA